MQWQSTTDYEYIYRQYSLVYHIIIIISYNHKKIYHYFFYDDSFIILIYDYEILTRLITNY